MTGLRQDLVPAFPPGLRIALDAETAHVVVIALKTAARDARRSNGGTAL